MLAHEHSSRFARARLPLQRRCRIRASAERRRAAPACAQAPGDAERGAALEIYRKIVSFDTSVEGGQTPAMAAYLADRFRAAGFAEQDGPGVPPASTASLAVRYRGDRTGEAALLLLAHM